MYTNKQRVLILSSRGITARYRHLMEDMKKLIPHHKKDNKLDTKGDIHVVNEIAELKSCNQIMYFETKKNQDLYMYLGKAPHGPSVKFHVVNVHTMDELKLTGNCMLGSRPVLNFDARFDTEPHLQLLKAILGDAFGTPRGHPKSKPFVDRVMSFFAVKNTIWIRNYQIVDKSERGSNDVSLVEIGPRMVLIPVRIFSGSLGGATLYQNPTFISPNEQRSTIKKSKGYVVCVCVFSLHLFAHFVFFFHCYQRLQQEPLHGAPGTKKEEGGHAHIDETAQRPSRRHACVPGVRNVSGLQAATDPLHWHLR